MNNKIAQIKQSEIKLKLLRPKESEEILETDVVQFYKNLINILSEKN